jgi:hypothetical protein
VKSLMTISKPPSVHSTRRFSSWLRERLHDAIRRQFARRTVRLQTITADQPAIGAGAFVEKQRHGLQL